jgi:hypothetical protein
MSEQLQLFDPGPAGELPPPPAKPPRLVDAHPKSNPCVAAFGAGPAGKICKSCVRFQSDDYHGVTYHKCELRGMTHGPGTDHRVKWPACSKYEEREAGE